MGTLFVPCPACGTDNPISSSCCVNCRSPVRFQLRPVATTQCIDLTSSVSGDAKEELIREAYIVSTLLLYAAHRLKALLD